MKYYFIGIKGTGMSALATIMHDLGNTVIGYDDYKDHKFTEDPLNERNIKIYTDDSYELTDEIVVYSSAFSNNHKEMQKAIAKNLKMYEYTQMVGELTKINKTICVSGCHGKTTTTSFLAHVLNNIIGVNYIIGDSTGYAAKENDYLVVESCEYRRHFLNYDPTITIITNIELDHTDYYKDLDDMIDAYQSLVNNTKDIVILCGDDQNNRKLKVSSPVYYGLNENNDVIAKNITSDLEYTYFDAYVNGKLYGHIKIKLFGKHMVLNTLAVIALCDKLNLAKEKVINEISTFKGAKRRFSEKVVNGTIIIDDYGHHPTELKMSIEACRTKYKDKKICAFFLPNTYSRVAKFYKEFAESLSLADKAFILDIAKGRENPDDYKGISSKLICDLIPNAEMITLEDEKRILPYKDYVLLFMSCQNIYILEERLEKILKWPKRKKY